MRAMRPKTTTQYTIDKQQHAVVRVHRDHSKVYKVKFTEYSSSQCDIATPLRKLPCHVPSQSVTCHPAEVTFPPFPQLMLVFDLATPKGCKAEYRHCSKVQPVPKAAHRSSYRDKQSSALRYEPGSSHTADGRANHSATATCDRVSK